MTMKLEEAKRYLPERVYDMIKGRITEFMPPQTEAIKRGLFDGKNILVSSPTASGKTLIGELAAINAITRGKKAIYLGPMRALVSEKFHDFRSDYPGISSAISIGDYSDYDRSLSKHDMIFLSNEKFDSLIRNSAAGFKDIGCIIYDEIHLLTEPDRGPTLEFIMALNRRIFPKAQAIALSATINNREELAKWMDAELVYSEFRPVKLLKKTYFDGELLNGSKKRINNVDDPLLNLGIELLKEGKQALIFANTKKSTIASAKLMAAATGPKLSAAEKQRLGDISSSIMSVLDRPTAQCEELASLVRSGVAFHHAGLLNKQRKMVEDGFKDGTIKFIVATPTLAMGVNLPANTVLVSSIYRYGDYGMEPISRMEMDQMLGRAGRPKYDKEGTAIIIANNDRTYDLIQEKYFEGELEPVVSKFNNEIAIRKYVLSLVCMEVYNSKEKIYDFFEGLFASEQFDLSDKVSEAIDFLEDAGFLQGGSETLVPTRLGKLVNALYLDPRTGLMFIKFVEAVKDKKALDPLDILHVVFCSDEFRFIRTSSSEFEKLEEESYSLDLHADQNIIDYDRFISAIRMAKLMNEWISESPERALEETFNVQPGELYSTLQNVIWLAYSLKEISKALGANTREMIKLGIRLKHGIKEELIPLVSIPEIGRVRARRLYASGLKRIADLRDASLERLSAVLGKKIAKNVSEYLHAHTDKQETLIP